jgi:predicted small lipoprotein YifL
MPSLPIILLFTLLTIICWGNYGPLMHHGQDLMDRSSLRPFIAVGMAYFLVAVLAPLGMLRTKGEKGQWTVGGTVFSLIAGTVGALGALGVIVSFKFGGKPVYVMPLVFGLAPVVNTIVTAAMAGTFKNINMTFLWGIILAACGAAGVLYFKPTASPGTGHTAAVVAPTDTAVANGEEAMPSTPAVAAPRTVDWPMLVTSVVMAFICWGSYGPLLHQGQARMEGSRLRPFLCVGLAYFAIAVALPMLILAAWTEPGRWTTAGTIWSLLGGAAGAIGALGIILAFNAGGKPIFVMPLVFGLAPVVNTLVTTTTDGLWDQIRLPFMISLGLAIAGAVTVLIFAPKGAHAPQPKPTPVESATQPQSP